MIKSRRGRDALWLLGPTERDGGRKKGVGGGHGRQAHQPSSLSQVVAAGDTGHEELWDEEDVPVHGGRGPGSHGVLRCL